MNRTTGIGTTESSDTGLDRRAYAIYVLATLLGLAHHVDHVVRGNHVGWPITADVTPFTYSLIIYPLIVGGFLGATRGWAGARYWTIVTAFGTAMLVVSHVSPWAVEPPADVIGPYTNPLVGYLAFAGLSLLIAVVALSSVYSAYRWRTAS